MAILLKNVTKAFVQKYVRKIKDIQQSSNVKGHNSTPSRGSCEDANERDRLAGCTVALDKSPDTIHFVGLLILRQLLVYVQAVHRDNSGIGRIQEVWTYSNE